MSTIASQITSLTIVYSTVYSDANQRKHQSSASLAFVRGIHRGPVNFPHKGPITRKMFPFDDVIMIWHAKSWYNTKYNDPLVGCCSVVYLLLKGCLKEFCVVADKFISMIQWLITLPVGFWDTLYIWKHNAALQIWPTTPYSYFSP